MPHKKDHKPSTRSWGPFGFVQDIISPWLGTPPGELKQVTQFKQATRVAAEGLDQTFTGGMIKAGTQSNKALAKQAAVNAAALGTGYIAGKAIQTGRVVNPIKTISNLVKNQKVVVHGHPRNLVGNVIEPRSGSFGAQSLGKPVAFALDPRKSGSKRLVSEAAFEYANKPLNFTNPQISIATTPKSNIKNFSDAKILLPNNRAMNYVYSTQPIPVSRTIRATGNLEDVATQLRRALRKEGVSLRGDTSNTIRNYASRIVEQRKKNVKPQTWRQ
jgi:hypothetical protein